MADPAPKANPQTNGLGYNPRPLRRDIGNYLSSKYTTSPIIATLISGSKDIASFQNTLQGGTGVHSGAHFTIGSDPGGDFYTSPGDPAFWLLHAMIDRIWYIWQSQDLQNRMQVIAGGTAMFGGNTLGTLNDIVNITYVAKVVPQLKDLMSTVDGLFCYVYE
jgi:tyrosinase